MTDNFDIIFDECKQNLISLTDENLWSNLLDSIKKSIISAEMTIRTMNENMNVSKSIDFSGIIILLTRSIESILIDQFYMPYIQYLKKHYKNNAESYLNDNGIANGDERRKIVYYSPYAQIYKFCSGRNKENEVEFTLGNFASTIGVDYNKTRWTCDKSIIEFYRAKYFVNENDDQKIKDWLRKIYTCIDSLVKCRNESAHGGENGGIFHTLEDAKNVMKIAVKDDKLVFSIFSPSI